MKAADVKRFWSRQSRSARVWGTVGLVGLFAFVAVGVFLAVNGATHTRTHAATGPVPSSGAVEATRLGPSPTPADPLPSSAGPSALSGSVLGSNGSGGSGTSGGSGSGGAGATAPDPPGSVALAVVERFNNDLAVTVRWTKPNDHGQAISRYDVVVHSAPDAPIPVSTTATATETTVMVPCGTSCGSRTVTATIQAVNAVGSSPQASRSFGGGLPADNMTCMFAGEAGISETLECTLYDTNVSTVWTVKNSNAQTTYNNVSKVSVLCPFTPQFDTLVVTVSASNSAGTNIRGLSYTCPV